MDTMTAPATLLENEYVSELLSTMRGNKIDSSELVGILNLVGAMEQQLEAATKELASMHTELRNMREERNHPIRTAAKKAMTALKNKISDMREKLSILKNDIINGCKDAVDAFKKNGVITLNNAASFLHIRQGLESIAKSAEKNIAFDDKMAAKIEAASTEYHQAGKSIRNMGRAMIGKDAITQVKPVGRLAEMAKAPLKLDKKLSEHTSRNVVAAIAKLDNLEQTAIHHKETKKEKKPSLIKNLKDLKKQAAETKLDAPVKDRPKTQESSL